MQVNYFIAFFIIIFKVSIIECQTGDIYFPGYRPERTNPIIARTVNIPLSDKELYKGGLLFGPTDSVPPPPNEAFLPVHSSSGAVYMLPKIFYQKSDRKSNVNGNLNPPDFTNPLGLVGNFLSLNGKSESRDNSLGGVYIPMPFGWNPVAFQLVGKNELTDTAHLGLGFDQSNNRIGSNSNINDPPISNPLASVTKQPDALLRFIQNAGQYLLRRQNSIPSESSNQNLPAADVPQQRSLVDPTLFSPTDLHNPSSEISASIPNKLALLRNPQPDIVKPELGVFDRGVVPVNPSNNNNNPEFLQKLASNIVDSIIKVHQSAAASQQQQQERLLRLQQRPLSDFSSNITAPGLDVGGYGNSDELLKANGIYMSVPFLPATYLGSYSNYEKIDNKGFG